jgi:hypothetical protein
MSIHSTILKINRELISSFALLDSYFDRDEKFLNQQTGQGWNAAQILEHVMLTNQYLLILIEKGATRALVLARENREFIETGKNYSVENAALLEIGIHKSFAWENPAHMEPKGTRALTEIRCELRDQLYQCLCILDALRKGEGLLYKTTMTVNNLGKLDVYQYLYFLVLHLKRHLTQLERREYNSQFTAC